MIIRDCDNCKKDYMFDPNQQPQFKYICQDCHEIEKLINKAKDPIHKKVLKNLMR